MLRHRLSLAGLAVLAGVLGLPAAAHAEGETPLAPATEIPVTPKPETDDRDKDRLEALKRQHEELEFKKRTNAPFTSERSLRHQLRRNEAQQGWEKSEQRRLEYEQLRQQRDSRNR